jgi:hypothetical protein
MKQIFLTEIQTIKWAVVRLLLTSLLMKFNNFLEFVADF